MNKEYLELLLETADNYYAISRDSERKYNQTIKKMILELQKKLGYVSLLDYNLEFDCSYNNSENYVKYIRVDENDIIWVSLNEEPNSTQSWLKIGYDRKIDFSSLYNILNEIIDEMFN